jgi:hypothetical protein
LTVDIGWYKVETLNGLWTHSQYKLTVDIKLKRWMACEPTANTSWQLIFLVAIFCGSHSRRCVNCHHLCTYGDIFVFSVVLLFVYIYIVYSYILNCGQIRQYQAYISVSVFIRPYRIIEFKAQLKFRYQVRPLWFISVIATTVGLLDIHM